MIKLVLQVVGGMTWCVTTCNFDIDVDLLFQENSTIGQKMYVYHEDRKLIQFLFYICLKYLIRNVGLDYWVCIMSLSAIF